MREYRIEKCQNTWTPLQHGMCQTESDNISIFGGPYGNFAPDAPRRFYDSNIQYIIR